MLTVRYSNTKTIDDGFYVWWLKKLPLPMQAKIEKYRNESDRKLTILGKVLLLNLIEHYGLDNDLFLSDLETNEYNRPSFNHQFDFNISHSGRIAICASIMNDSVGIDIEEMVEIKVDEFKNQFSCNELRVIEQSDNPNYDFFKLWTRKEAVVKAIGTGITILSEIEVLKDIVCYNSQAYRIETLPIDDWYIASLSYTGSKKDIVIEKMIIADNSLLPGNNRLYIR